MRPLSAILAALALLAGAQAVAARPAAPSGPGRTFTANGVTIWYEVRGAGGGTPLVVCNGGPGFDHTYELCSDAWDTIARSRRVVFWDQRGTGRSSPLGPATSCRLADQVADLEALRAELKAPVMDVLGHSWGGYLAMAYTALHPGAVSHLVLVDSAAPRWSETEFMFKNFFPDREDAQGRRDFLAALGDTSAPAEGLREYFRLLFVSTAKRDEFVAQAPRFRMNRAVNAALNADLGALDLTPMLGQFRCPALVVTGRYDVNVAPSTAWKIHRAIPGSRFVVCEQSGHLPFFEEPAAFVKAIEDFLRAPGR